MTFADDAKYSMIEYHSIYPTFGQYLDHLFVVIGNGLEWNHGTLGENNFDQAKMAALPELERMAMDTNRAGLNIPRSLKYSLGVREIPVDTQKRLDDYTITSAYGFHKEYSCIAHIPDDIQPDWLNAAWAYLQVLVELPPENFMRYRMATSEHNMAKQEHTDTIAAAKNILASLPVRFPNHVFEKPVITLDPNRPDVPGLKYWSHNYNTVDPSIIELIKPFHDAIHFAYRVTPKDKSTGEARLTAILRQAAEAAITLGHRVVNTKLQEYSILDIPGPIKEILTGYPKEDSNVYFEDLVEPFVKMVRKAYSLRRINRKKAVPYSGYPNGFDTRDGTSEPWRRFQVESMKYDEYDQGRDAIRVIVGMMFTVISEIGCREIRRAVLNVCATLPHEPPEEDWDVKWKRMCDAMTPEELEAQEKFMLTALET